MRLPYQFNEKSDPVDYKWGMTAESMLKDYIFNNKNNYWSESRGIEAQVNTLAESFGGIVDLMISKGLINPQEFIDAIGASSIYEVRESNS